MPPLRATLLVAAIPLVVGVAWAQTRIDPNGVSVSGSVIGDDVLYSIGGGRAVSMGGAGNMQGIGVGVGWNSNLICGDMSITTTLQNQLNGITNGFQTIMSNVIQSATSRRGLAAGPDHPARRPGALQPADQRHPPGAPGLRPLEDDLPGHRQSDGGHGRRPGRLGPARRGDGAAGRGQPAPMRCRPSSGPSPTRGNNGVPWVGGGNARAAPGRARSRWSAT
jgi:hypothetical protein